MSEQVLSGIKVLDLTYDIAGPYCTKLLADFGADVLKVERPVGGDLSRAAGPFPGDVPHPEKSGLFLHLNTNKFGITLNLAAPEGAAILKRLAAEADILVESFPPGTLASWGLSYETLAAENPCLILTHVTPFGQTGPYRDYQA
ncbi:MAG: CoA transferase, partial [Chloroflexi bacterium]|nr:CoA transferase [Chloroflexota bacterium]